MVRIGRQRAVVEVKTRRAGDGHPLDNYTRKKADKVRETARALSPPVHRVDLIMITVDTEGIDIHWVPHAARTSGL